MGLSKGTLGLKFMNRQAPVAASTPPPSAAAASTPTPATSKPANPPAPTSKGSVATATDRKTGERTTKRNEWDPSSTAASSRTSVVHETSLLSFPLLSTLNKSTNAGPSSSSSSMTATYSSMPLTSAMVSGRRSFGGANVEIEKLNDPSSHQAAPEKTADSSKSKTSSKRLKKADRDAAPVESVRGGKNKSGSNLSGPKAGKRTADLERRGVAGGGGEEEEEDGANKKKRRKTDELNNVPARRELDVDDEGAQVPAVGRKNSGGDERSTASTTTTTKKATAAEFARPAGFDGVKKTQAKPAAGKGKGKGRMMDDEQYQWAKQGETREWDAGKSSQEEEDETDSDSDSEEEEEERMVSSSSSDEESSEEDEEDEEEEAIMADEQRFSEAADRAVGGRGGGGGHSSSRGGWAGSQSKSRRGQGRR